MAATAAAPATVSAVAAPAMVITAMAMAATVLVAVFIVVYMNLAIAATAAALLTEVAARCHMTGKNVIEEMSHGVLYIVRCVLRYILRSILSTSKYPRAVHLALDKGEPDLERLAGKVLSDWILLVRLSSK